MSVDRATVRGFTCYPGGKRTSSKETVLIFGTKRIVEHLWRPHPRGIQVFSAAIKQNGQKGISLTAVVDGEFEALTDVSRAHTEDLTKICKASSR